MDGLSDYYTDYAHTIISESYVRGGIKILKEKFPKNYGDMEQNLKDNWSKAGIDQYCKSMIAGLKQVGYWKEIKKIVG